MFMLSLKSICSPPFGGSFGTLQPDAATADLRSDVDIFCPLCGLRKLPLVAMACAATMCHCVTSFLCLVLLYVSVCKSQGFLLKNFDVAHTCLLQAFCFIGYKLSFGSLHFCFCLSFSFCISRYVEYGTLVFCSKFTRFSTAFLRLLAFTALSSSECALK